MEQDTKQRLRSNNLGKSNVLGRVSTNFKKNMDNINKAREKNGLDILSYPKITELIIRHKNCWNTISKDIINYNTYLDKDNMEVDFNDE